MATTALLGTLRVKTSAGQIVIMYPKTIADQVEGLAAYLATLTIPAPIRDTEANLTALTTPLANGQFAITTNGTNANRVKIGNGSSTWSQLEYFGGSATISLAEQVLGSSTIIRTVSGNTTSDTYVYDANVRIYVKDETQNEYFYVDTNTQWG